MEKSNFVFFLVLIQLCDVVFSSEENVTQEPMSDLHIERVNDACNSIDECKYECCQLNRIYSIATSHCNTQHIDEQLSAINWKSPFTASHKLSCEAVCSENVDEERMEAEEHFRKYMNSVISDPGYLCDDFVQVCYTYAVKHQANLATMDPFWIVWLPVLTVVLSISLMAFTLLLYLAVPELCSRIQDKCFLFYLSFRILYFSVYLRQVFAHDEDDIFRCKFSAFLLQFSGLAAGFWLNVICIHLWRSINSIIPVFQSATKTMCYYSLYACGCSLLVAVITHSADYWLPEEYNSYKPGIGEELCGIKGYDKHIGKELWRQPMFIYYFSVQIIIQAINFGAFLHIVHLIVSKEKLFKKKQNETLRRHQIQQLGFLTYIKLFLLMGLTTILEIIFFHLGRSAIQKLLLRFVSAFLLFIIFVCNKRVYRLVKKRISQLTPQSSVKTVRSFSHGTVLRESTRSTKLNTMEA